MKGIKKAARILASITMEQWEAILTLSDKSKEFMKKDFLIFCDKLGENTDLVNQSKETPERIELMTKIKMVMKKCGILKDTNRYKYFLDAIMLAYEDDECVDLITKTLYPKIGKKYNISISGVQRSMHYCLCKVFKNENNPFVAEVFAKIPKKNGVPANGDFILCVVEYLKNN